MAVSRKLAELQTARRKLAAALGVEPESVNPPPAGYAKALLDLGALDAAIAAEEAAIAEFAERAIVTKQMVGHAAKQGKFA